MEPIQISPTVATAEGFAPRLGRSVLVEQAAAMLAVSRRTIYYWIHDGRLRTVRTLNGSQRVLLESLQAQARVMARADLGLDAPDMLSN
jgi:excisionase family DNA binding protein